MRAEHDKKDFYEKNYDCEGDILVPAAIDTYGRWGDDLSKLVTQVARTGSQNEKHYSRIVHRLRLILATAHVKAIGRQMAGFLQLHLYSD